MPPQPTATTRDGQHSLSVRQAATQAALLDAGLAELRAVGFEAMTIRSVAARAGVTHTTAYGYFSSKDHVVAEILWRATSSLGPPDVDPSSSARHRVGAALEDLRTALFSEPALAHGALIALMSSDAIVAARRDDIGAAVIGRLLVAIGTEDSRAVESLFLVFTGSMLLAGMGYFDFDGVIDRVAAAAELLEV